MSRAGGGQGWKDERMTAVLGWSRRAMWGGFGAGGATAPALTGRSGARGVEMFVIFLTPKAALCRSSGVPLGGEGGSPGSQAVPGLGHSHQPNLGYWMVPA